jgi:hypothetical protein
MARLGGSRILKTALDVASVVALIAAVVLLWRSQHAGRTATAAPAAQTPVLTDSVPTQFAVTKTAGETEWLPSASGTRQLLLLFRTDCPACTAQKSDWRAIAADARAQGIRVVALTPEALSPWVHTYFESDPVEVASIIRPELVFDNLATSSVPTTIALDATGHIIFHHPGRMPEDAVIALREKLRL